MRGSPSESARQAAMLERFVLEALGRINGRIARAAFEALVQARSIRSLDLGDDFTLLAQVHDFPSMVTDFEAREREYEANRREFREAARA